MASANAEMLFNESLHAEIAFLCCSRQALLEVSI